MKTFQSLQDFWNHIDPSLSGWVLQSVRYIHNDNPTLTLGIERIPAQRAIVIWVSGSFPNPLGAPDLNYPGLEFSFPIEPFLISEVQINARPYGEDDIFSIGFVDQSGIIRTEILIDNYLPLWEEL